MKRIYTILHLLFVLISSNANELIKDLLNGNAHDIKFEAV